MTKNIIGAVAALLLGSTSVLAADLPVKAPPPPAIYDWTGFYLGGSVGGTFGGSNHVDRRTGLNDTEDGYRLTGGLVGGTVGYNWQISRFVIGFEGDGSWVGLYGSNHDNGPAVGAAFLNAAGNPLFQSFTKETWLATARARVGYAVNNLLFYGTGGYAAAGVDAGIKSGVTNALIASSTETRSGWTAGVGLEWGFAPNWSTKWEVLYMKFEDKPFLTTLGEGPRSAVTLDQYVFRAGINYRFGGPTIARY